MEMKELSRWFIEKSALSDRPALTDRLEQFQQGLRLLEQRIAAGHRPSVEELGRLYANVALKIAFGPTRAFVKETGDWPDQVDLDFYSHMLSSFSDSLRDLFSNPEWGDCTVSLESFTVAEEHDCSGVAVKWSRPWDLLAQHYSSKERVEKQFSAMAASLSLMLAAAWTTWRLDVA